MKNLTKIFMAVVAGMFAFSCVTDTTEDLGVNVEGQKGGVYEVAISLEEATKTQLGEKVDGLYPLYWSEGDAIAINGVVSNPLAEGGSANAYFKFNEPVARPFCVVYPAPTAAAVEDEVVEEPAAPITVYPVTFAAEQPYTAGTFAPGVAPMYGYAAALAEGETETPIQLNHLTGVLRFAIKGNGEKVTSMKVVAEKGTIAGPYTVDCTNGTLVAQPEATSTITVTFGEGLVLGAEATPVYVTVPAGSYGTFLVTLYTEADNKMTVKFNSDVKPIKVGTVREFSEFTYQENSADTENAEYLIDDAEALINFAKIAGSFYPRTKAIVTAEIDMTGVEWSPIQNFGAYEFDGGNFAIKGLSAPLFAQTAANIKNVKLTDVNYTVTDLAKSGAVVCELYGSIDNCSVSGAIEINNTTFAPAKASDNYNDVAHAGVVGMAYKATITNCVNNASVTLTSLCKAESSVKCAAGGVVGVVSDNCTINHLTNNGNVTLASTTQKENIYVSGVIGKNDDTNGQNDFAAISKCTNNGDISSTATSVCGTDLLLAGVTGRLDAGAETVVENLVNTGNITVAGKSANTRAAGLVTYTASATLNNSYNTGAINIAATATFSGNVYASGLISATITTAGISNCYNSGAISVADGLTFTKLLDVNGVFNTITGNAGDALITGVVNRGPITIGKVINNTFTGDSGNNERMYVGGVCHQTTAGTFKNCYNDVAGTINVDIKKWASRLMAGGFQAYQSYSVAGVNLENCENRAALSFNSEDLESATIGGIGSEYYAAATHTGLINYKNVVNKGNITVTGTIKTSGYPRLGGVLGLDNGPGLTLDGCVNEATLTVNTTDTAGPQVGGIMGADTNKKEVTIKNCENKGHIELAGVVTSYIRMGGILGSKTVNTPTNITGCVNSGTLAITGTQTATGNAYAVGGIVGYVSTDCLTISECVNGVENDTTGKGAITLGTVPGGYGVAGILGMFALDKTGKSVNVNDCINYATIKQTGKGGGSGRGCLGGIMGTATGKKDNQNSVYIDGCENYGAIEYGTTACGDRISLGGIIGEPQQYNYAEITNCTNGGTVAFKAKGCGKEISVGGIAGMISTSMKITDCVNLATGTIIAAGSTSTNYEFGGITGSTSGTGTQLLRCVNYAEVKQTAYSTGTTQFGGIIGYAYSFGTIDNCHNHGQLTIMGADSADQLSVGGVVGYSRYQVTDGVATISNCYNHADLTFAGRGKYYAGGVIGYDKSVEKGSAVLKNLVNVGNLTFSSTATTFYYGGLVGAANNPVEGGVFYGNITALGKEGKVGALLGKARTDALKVTNCQIGGNFIYSEEEDEDANGEKVMVGVKTPIDLTMLYTTAIEASVAEGDGCSVITEKPAVPTAPAAPAQ